MLGCLEGQSDGCVEGWRVGCDTSVFNISNSTDVSLNAGKSTKLQRTTNLNSAEIKFCNFLLLGKAEQVILDTSMFCKALIQRRFDNSACSVQGERISPNATPDNGGSG